MNRNHLVALAVAMTLSVSAGAADFQWRGPGNLGAAINSCRVVTGHGAHTVVRFSPYGVSVIDYPATYDSSAEPKCMKRLGFVRDNTIIEPAQNPEFVEFYEEQTGVRLKTRAQSIADEREHESDLAARAAAKRAQEDAQLDRCKSPDRTVGDVEACEAIRSDRSIE